MSRNQKPLNIIWRKSTLDDVLEGNFIHNVLLSKIDRPLRRLIFDEDHQFPAINNSLVVSLYDENHKLVKALSQKGAKNIGILQMGDEYGVMPEDYKGDVDYVLRNYFFPEKHILKEGKRCKDIEWIPNGYANGVAPGVSSETILPFNQRLQTLFFSGYIHNKKNPLVEREDMVSVIRENKLPAVIMGTDGFAGGLGRATFASHLSNSKYALCPAGNSTETIRFYDAIENGAIPVIVKTDYLVAKQALNGAPVVMLDRWQDLAGFLEAAQSKSDQENIEFQTNLRNWWIDYKEKKAQRVAEMVQANWH